MAISDETCWRLIVSDRRMTEMLDRDDERSHLEITFGTVTGEEP